MYTARRFLVSTWPFWQPIKAPWPVGLTLNVPHFGLLVTAVEACLVLTAVEMVNLDGCRRVGCGAFRFVSCFPNTKPRAYSFH